MKLVIRHQALGARERKMHSALPIAYSLVPSAYSRGFALLIAIIFMSVMLSFGLALGSIGYKQQVLASNAIESQYAFYAADAALECALYADQGAGQNIFAYQSPQPSTAPLMTCDVSGSVTFPPASPTGIVSYTASQWVLAERLSLDGGKRCADVTIYKPSPNSGGITYIFSQGYDVSCNSMGTNPRFVSRGLNAHY